MIAIIVPDAVEMGELGANAAEVVPDAGKNRLNFLRRFLRKGRLQIVATYLVLAKLRADQAREAAEQVGGLGGIEIARGAQ